MCANQDPTSSAIKNDNQVAGNAIIAEYNVLRAEMSLYHQHQKEFINFSFAIFVGAIGAIVPIAAKDNPKVAIVLLFVPILFTVLEAFYLDRMLRILRIADYIHNYLRHKMVRVANFPVWQWELYKRHASPFPKSGALLLDRLRWVVFVVPGAICVVVFFSLRPWGTLFTFEAILLVSAIVSLLASLFMLVFLEETTGITDRHMVDIDKFGA